jgi:hypothetical protein
MIPSVGAGEKTHRTAGAPPQPLTLAKMIFFNHLNNLLDGCDQSIFGTLNLKYQRWTGSAAVFVEILLERLLDELGHGDALLEAVDARAYHQVVI